MLIKDAQGNTMKRIRMRNHELNAADAMTMLRIAGTVLLVFLRPLSAGFLLVYTLTGLTDALDGWLARRTGTASSFGARLDSAADLLFFAAMLIRLFPVLLQALPAQLWFTAAGVFLLRVSAYCVAAVRFRRFAPLHTWLNKLTGGALFLLPYMLAASSGAAYSRALCALACASALEELMLQLSRESCDEDAASILQRRAVRRNPVRTK